MINDRSQGGVGPDVNTAGATYWLSDKQPLTDIKNWRQVTQANSQKLLVAAADKFPTHDPTENEKQSHITILVHGFNNKFTSATRFYQDLCGRLFEEPDSLGPCILYDWPSGGSNTRLEPQKAARKAFFLLYKSLPVRLKVTWGRDLVRMRGATP
jgi:esterase/lipase superfamily enzyme